MPQFPLDQSDAQLVAEACSRAAQVLGLSPKELSEVLSMNQPNADDKDLVCCPRDTRAKTLNLFQD
jgi:hypothetical protein